MNSNGSGPSTNGHTPEPTTNSRGIGDLPPDIVERLFDLTANAMTARQQWFQTLFDPRRNIEEECGLPDWGSGISVEMYRQFYDRFPIANRAVVLLPKECWQVSPQVWESDDAQQRTPFEEDWDALGAALSPGGGRSWHIDETGSPIWEHVSRADSLSRIGAFGVILLGFDDGLDLAAPVPGILKTDTLPTRNELANLETALDVPRDMKAKHLGPLSDNEKRVLNEMKAELDLIEQTRNAPPFPPHKMPTSRATRLDGSQFLDSEPSALDPMGGVGQPNQLGGKADLSGGRYKEGFGPTPLDQSASGGWGPTYGASSDSQQSLDAQGGPGYGTSASTAWGGAGVSSQPGTDQQYFGVQFGPVEVPSDEPPPEGGKRKLLFVRAFSEDLVQIVRYEWNIRSPRFGLPVMYRVTLNDPRDQHSGVGLPLATVFVHWSRIIHLADVHANPCSSEIFAPPVMRPILDNLLGLKKIYAAAPEGYWQSCLTGYSFETHPQLGGDVKINTADMKDQIEQFMNRLQRHFLTTGMEVKTLAPNVSDPTSQVTAQLEAICIQLGCPVRVFKGSERGELASSQDDSKWNDVLRNRQNLYLTPRVIIPLIDRLILVGILREPGKNSASKVVANARRAGHRVIERSDGWLVILNNGNRERWERFGKASHLHNAAPTAADDRPDPSTEEGDGQDVADAFDQGEPEGAWVGQGDDGEVHQPFVTPESEGGPAPLDPHLLKGAKWISRKGYIVEWPDLESLGESEKATIASTKTTAIAAYAALQPGPAVPPPLDFYTRVMGMEEEEARTMCEEAVIAGQNAPPPEGESAGAPANKIGPGESAVDPNTGQITATSPHPPVQPVHYLGHPPVAPGQPPVPHGAAPPASPMTHLPAVPSHQGFGSPAGHPPPFVGNTERDPLTGRWMTSQDGSLHAAQGKDHYYRIVTTGKTHRLTAVKDGRATEIGKFRKLDNAKAAATEHELEHLDSLTSNASLPPFVGNARVDNAWVSLNENPNHDERGRFARSALSGLARLHDKIRQPDGGFTYSISTDSSPTTGYALSPYPDRSFAIDASQLRLAHLVRYVKDNADLLSLPDHHLGAWHDPSSGKVFLDVSVVKQDKEAAHELCLKHDQIAYFDLKEGKSVTVNPRATSGGAVKNTSNRGVANERGATASDQGGAGRRGPGGAEDTVPRFDREEPNRRGVGRGPAGTGTLNEQDESGHCHDEKGHWTACDSGGGGDSDAAGIPPLSPLCKSLLRSNREQAKINAERTERDLLSAGMSQKEVDELKQQLQQVYDEAEVTINFQPRRRMEPAEDEDGTVSTATGDKCPTMIDELLRDPTLKNLHQTGTGGGTTDEDLRMNWEESNFGEDVGALLKDRPDEMPKYGALNIGSMPEGNEGAMNYGNCHFVLKKAAIKDRLTLTPTNSSSTSSRQVGSHDHPLVALAFNEEPLEEVPSKQRKLLEDNFPVNEKGYVEAQIWGKLPLNKDTVERIRVSKNLSAEVLSKLHQLGHKMGVPVEVIGEM